MFIARAGRTGQPAGVSQDGYTTDLLLPATMSAAPAMASMPGMASMADPDAHITHVSRDYIYPMRQRAATLWYHDHRMGFTGPSITRGLAGFHLIHDEEERAIPLPTGDRDIPLTSSSDDDHDDHADRPPEMSPPQPS